MPGVVFLVVVPTANFERELINASKWDSNELAPETISSPGPGGVGGIRSARGNNLNINLPDNNAILRLEVELRDKNAPKQRGGRHQGAIPGAARNNRLKSKEHNGSGQKDNMDFMVPLEKVLEELLSKLAIEHVTWSSDKRGNYYQVVFPIQSGEPCETTLHCLTELGIGTKLNSSVSESSEDLIKWNNFVDSIKSKLTVKQVVDGVRAGGSLSFDYILLIVTADSLAALGLIENNAPNIVAAMLVSPLMGPVMSITFGTMISDRELMKVGFISLALGMFISLLFGFIFGLILGTTAMPWGFNDWPTEEMRGRGNVRSLWMGVLWALTSGTGVAVALLQGSAGPLIGVAISASLLPPVVNCGLFWALACIWLIYPDIKIPHLKGEEYVGNSTYPFIYTKYLPTEFLINGIVSGLLTVVNVICIFITAIIILKIKEVAAPYTSSPDLRRFWETDIRMVRRTNRSTVRRRNTLLQERNQQPYHGLDESKSKELEHALRQALKEAADDDTFRKVKRMSYSSNAAGELTQRLHIGSGGEAMVESTSGGLGSVRNSKLNAAEMKSLDKLVSTLLEHSQNQQQTDFRQLPATKNSTKLNRWRPFSRSMTGLMAHGGSIRSSRSKGPNSRDNSKDNPMSIGNTNINAPNSISGGADAGAVGGIQHTSLMPTILEQQVSRSKNALSDDSNHTSRSSWSDKVVTAAGVRRVLNSIANAPHRFSQSMGQDEENDSLAKNILD